MLSSNIFIPESCSGDTSIFGEKELALVFRVLLHDSKTNNFTQKNGAELCVCLCLLLFIVKLLVISL